MPMPAFATGSAIVYGSWQNNAAITDPDIDGGTIDNTVIGGTTPAAGAFTALSATSLALPIVSKTADYILTSSDYTCLVTASSVNVTITLPAAAGCSGRIYNIKKLDATVYTVIIDGNSSETIDGALTYSLTSQYESISIQSNGTAWYII